MIYHVAPRQNIAHAFIYILPIGIAVTLAYKQSANIPFYKGVSKTTRTLRVRVNVASRIDLKDTPLADIHIAMATSVKTVNSDPLSFREAMSSPERASWIKAMQEEYQSLVENNTFRPVSTPNRQKPLSTKWVYRRKAEADGTIRYKARLVVRGFEQVKGQDFDNVYAPVSKMSTFRLLLALCARHRYPMYQMDVVTAFLNPVIDKDNIVITMPRGMETIILDAPTYALLMKALYGLKQSPRLWFHDIDGFIMSLDMNFRKASKDENLYIASGVMLPLYVDDIFIVDMLPTVSNNPASRLKVALSEKYRMKDLGLASRFLGFEISREKGDIYLSQRLYIETILERYAMKSATTMVSPMDPNVSLDNTKCEDNALSPTEQVQYQSIVGSLMYAAIGTRPDIAFAVSKLCKYHSAPLSMHLTAAKRVLRYLKGTMHLRLRYSALPNDEIPSPSCQYDSIPAAPSPPSIGILLKGFCDSDWAGDHSTRKSMTGYIFFAGSTPVDWKSKQQSIVALSSLEAEFVAASAATAKASSLRILHHDVARSSSFSAPISTTVIAMDNQGALKVIKTGVFTERTRHIDVKFCHAIDESSKGTVSFEYVASAVNPADVLTKALGGIKQKEMVKLLHLVYETTTSDTAFPTDIDMT